MAINPEAVQWDSAAPPTGGDQPPGSLVGSAGTPAAGPPIDPKAVQWQPDFHADPHAGLSHTAGGVQLQRGSTLDQLLYPEVDFDTGLPFLDREHLSQADNFSESKLYLEKVYGKKNVEVDTDPYGDPMLVVVKDGKKIAAKGGNGLIGLGADIVGSEPEWLGAGAGAVRGAEGGAAVGSAVPGVGTAVGGLAGGVIGAGLGAGIGKQEIQLQKQAEGWYSQSNQEMVSNALRAVEGGATGEIGGGLTSKLASRFLRGRLPSIISGTTPEGRQLTDRLLDQGARPPLSTAGPDLKALQWKQRFAEQTVGPNKAAAEANAAFLRQRVRDLLGDSGLSDDQVEAISKQLEAGEDAIPTAEVGKHVKDRVQAHREMLHDNTRQRLSEAQGTLDNTMRHLDTLIGRYRTGELGVDVAGAIQDARRDFGTSMSKVYDRVDQLAGNRPIVDTTLVAREAQSMARRLPRTGQQPLVRETAGLGEAAGTTTPEDVALYESLGMKPPPADASLVTFSDAQSFRSALRAKADELSLTRDPKAAMAARLADMWDYAIHQAGRKPEAAPAVRMLDAADKAYAAGIKRFKDATVQRLVNDMKAGLPPDPETVAATIIQPGQEARVTEIRKLVGEGVWSRVAGADYSRMMTAATDENGQVSGQRLLREIRTRGKLMRQVYGDKQAAELTEFAKAIAVRDGKLDPQMLRPSGLRQTLLLYRQAEAQEDRFMKESALATLANPKGNPEQAYRWIVRPQNSHALEQAVQLFGENSPQIQGIRQTALQELLAQTKFAVADGRPAEALTEALKKYTDSQKKILFPNGMDSDLALLAKEVKALVPTESAGNVGIAAGAANAMPLWVRAPINIYFGFYNAIVSHPWTIRYLATGLRSESGPARIAARHMVESLVRYGAIEAASPSGDTGAPHGNPTQPGTGGSAADAVAMPQ